MSIAHPDRFFIASRLAEAQLAPIPAGSFPFDVWYGYHFDAVLLGKFLHKKALERGVKYKSCHVTHANLNDRGDIASVSTQEGETIGADFFVDCTGFASLLSIKALATPFVSFSDNLFNDAAVAMPTPMDEFIPSQTVATAMKHGWAWKIPLTSRYGNGYVYSSSFCSADQAEHELRESLGLLESDTPARHLKMRIGRLTKHWNRNCLAVGLSQGFIEPLEATALLFIQKTAMGIVEFLERGDFSEAAHDGFNQRVNEHFEGTRDYIVTHYKTNSRNGYGLLARQCRESQYLRSAEGPLQPLDGGQQHRHAGEAERRPGLPGLLLVLHHGRDGHIPGSGDTATRDREESSNSASRRSTIS